MAWRAAESLIVLRNQLQREAPRAAPPATDVNAWGFIGDAAHNPTSDHSPRNFPGWGNEIVTAFDFPHAPALGLDAHAVAVTMRQARDPRVKYIISNGSVTGPNHDWEWDTYTGSDPHSNHTHVSVVGAPISDERTPWKTGLEGIPMKYALVQERQPNSAPVGPIWYAINGYRVLRRTGTQDFVMSKLNEQITDFGPIWYTNEPAAFGPVIDPDLNPLTITDTQLGRLGDRIVAVIQEAVEEGTDFTAAVKKALREGTGV